MPYPPGQLLTLRECGSYILVIEALPGGYRAHDGKVYSNSSLSLFEMKHTNNPSDRCWGEAEIVYLLQNLNKGKSIRQLASHLQRSRNSVISLINRKLNGWGTNKSNGRGVYRVKQATPLKPVLHSKVTLPKLPWEQNRET